MLKTLLVPSAFALALAMPAALSAQETPPDDAATPETLDAAPDAGGADVDANPIDDGGTGDAPLDVTEPAGEGTPPQEGTTEPQGDGTLGQEDMSGSETPAAASTDTVIPAEEEGALRADKVIGMKVVDASGEQIGKVTDIILNPEGQMTGLVISSGGFLGIGAKKVGIKVDEADIDVESETVVANNLSQEAIKQAPTFKTQEDLQAEMEAQQRQQELDSQQQEPAAGGTY
ncbi:MAG: PRC-barrel domain-containing protein [Alphaproteobacteria bacterium]